MLEIHNFVGLEFQIRYLPNSDPSLRPKYLYLQHLDLGNT